MIDEMNDNHELREHHKEKLAAWAVILGREVTLFELLGLQNVVLGYLAETTKPAHDPKPGFREAINTGVALASEARIQAEDIRRFVEFNQICPKGHCSYSREGKDLTCEDCGTVFRWLEPPYGLMNGVGSSLDLAARREIGKRGERRPEEGDHEYRKRLIELWFSQQPKQG